MIDIRVASRQRILFVRSYPTPLARLEHRCRPRLAPRPRGGTVQPVLGRSDAQRRRFRLDQPPTPRGLHGGLKPSRVDACRHELGVLLCLLMVSWMVC